MARARDRNDNREWDSSFGAFPEDLGELNLTSDSEGSDDSDEIEVVSV